MASSHSNKLTDDEIIFWMGKIFSTMTIEYLNADDFDIFHDHYLFIRYKMWQPNCSGSLN